MSDNLATVLEAARKLPLDQQRWIAQELLKPEATANARSDAEQTAALEIVKRTHGVIKGLDRETLIRIAEDEEFCGY